jgi:hypothetical protein
MLITPGRPKQLLDKLKRSNDSLDKHLAAYSFKHNQDKETITPLISELGSAATLRTPMTLDPRMTLIAKYLGTLHHFRQSWSPEIATRIATAKNAYYIFWGHSGCKKKEEEAFRGKSKN